MLPVVLTQQQIGAEGEKSPQQYQALGLPAAMTFVAV